MNVITIDNKQYDPYFILDVTKEDSLEHIKKSFRGKVKKYHPDKYTDLLKKEKYEKYFKILSESYQYIKNKRQDTSVCQNKSKGGEQIKKNIDLDNFNKTFEKSKDPNYFGYGDDYNRIERIEDYENIDVKYCNQFENRKFTTKEFNKIFEYNKNSEDDKDKVVTKSMIHKTTDGFFGYNTSDITNCALVSSFNGLLVTGDNFGESGIGYWGNNYSDYKFSYKTSKNPNSKIIIKKDGKKKDGKKIDATNEDDTNEDDTIETKITSEEISKYKKGYDQYKYKKGYDQNTSGNFSQQENLLYKKTYEDLVKKEFEDKDMVIKYISQYSSETIDKALSGELQESRKYSSALRKYIKE